MVASNFFCKAIDRFVAVDIVMIDRAAVEIFLKTVSVVLPGVAGGGGCIGMGVVVVKVSWNPRYVEEPHWTGKDESAHVLPEVRFGNVALKDAIDSVFVRWVGEDFGESGDDRFAIGLDPRVGGGMLEDVKNGPQFGTVSALCWPMKKGRIIVGVAIGVIDSPP